MKKVSSVWMLYARSTIYKLLGLLVLLGAADGMLFCLAMKQHKGLEQIMVHSHIPLAALMVYLLWSAVLIVPASTKAGYTLDRLRISPKAVFACHAGYNTLCYIVLWGFQAILLLSLFVWYGTQADPAIYGPQSILLACYSDRFLHALLPLRDLTAVLRMLVLVISLGIMAAAVSIKLRRGKNVISLLIAMSVGLPAVFQIEVAAQVENILVLIGAMVIAVVTVYVSFSQPEEVRGYETLEEN